MRTAKSLSMLSALFLCAASCMAQNMAHSELFTADPAQSQVAFTLSDTIHTVHGTFHLQSGNVQFDPSSTPPQSHPMSGLLVVAAASGSSGDGIRDRRMANEYLQAQQFAVATFSPRSYTGAIAPAGDSTIQVEGTFTLHGTPHEITLPMQIHIEGGNCVAKTHFAIPYVQWGIKDPSTFLIHVNKQVDMDITLAGKLSPSTALSETRNP